MFGLQHTGTALDTIAHIIQTALTPVFLLSGIATLLNVFSTRLARVADKVDAVAAALECADAARVRFLSVQLAHLHRRSVALDFAVVLAAIGGAATCAAVLVLFVSALRDATIASALVGLFGLAVVCTLGAIIAYTFEMLIAGTGIRAEAAEGRRIARPTEPQEPAEAESHSENSGEPAPSSDAA